MTFVFLHKYLKEGEILSLENNDKEDVKQSDQTKFNLFDDKNVTNENYIGAIFGAGILIISFIILLCLGWEN